MQPLFEQLGKLTKLQRTLIGIVIFALLIAGFVFLSIKPLYEKIAVVEKKISDTEKLLLEAKQKAAALEGLKEDWAKKQEEFQVVMNALPDKQEIPTLLGDISAAGRNTGLLFNRFAPQGEIFRDFYAEIPVAISISGTYDRLRSFFGKVSEMSRVVNIKNINMSLSTKGGGGGKKGAVATTTPGLINVECTAATYRFLSEAEKAKTADTGKKGGKGKKDKDKDKDKENKAESKEKTEEKK
ncbi:MAG: type 4a pilus biogenesis protein PilO [Thermodesulfobacteriota bacterium]